MRKRLRGGIPGGRTLASRYDIRDIDDDDDDDYEDDDDDRHDNELFFMEIDE